MVDALTLRNNASQWEVLAGSVIGVDNEFARRYSLPFGIRRFLVLTCGGAVLIEPDAE